MKLTKKLILVLVACMLLSTQGICENADFADATDEELVSMFLQLQEEIYNRGLVPRPALDEDGDIVLGDIGEPFSSGVYTVGTDIKAGYYVISCSEFGVGDIIVFPDKESYDTYMTDSTADPQSLIKFYRHDLDEESVYISLTEGDILYVDMDERLEIAEANAFWHP